jgi:hypothetical protein
MSKPVGIGFPVFGHVMKSSGMFASGKMGHVGFQISLRCREGLGEGRLTFISLRALPLGAGR